MARRNKETTNLWRLPFVVGFLLLGYALASPVRLSLYFYQKATFEILTDGLIIAAVVLLTLRYARGKLPLLILTIPFLSLIWLRLDFLLYSMSDWFTIVSYLLLIWWGVAFTVFWKHFQPRVTKLVQLISALLIGGAGLVWGILDTDFWQVIVLSCLFIALVPYAGENALLGKRLMPEMPSWFLFLSPLIILVFLDEPDFFESQQHYHDKVVLSEETRFQRIDVTEWKGEYWFYHDRINQFSSIDSWLYFEPFAHPAIQLVPSEAQVLIIGGENGMLLNELSQYQQAQVTLLPVDPEYLEVAKTDSLFTRQNGGALSSPGLEIQDQEAFQWLNQHKAAYDLILVDVPDPIDVELNQYYSLEFYELCREALNTEGLLVTQSGSPYFATTAFQSIQLTMQKSGFHTTSYHNQVLTLGEWAWTLGSPVDSLITDRLKRLDFSSVSTRWLNQEAMQMMLSFGKPYVSSQQIEVNTIANPVIYRYYNQGNYEFN